MLNKISSLKAERYLERASSDLGRSFERLGSGQRINRPSDDAAGLAIASSLRTDARIYSRAIQNLSDGISYVSIADGALNELSNVLVRITELATQSANGSYSTQQRTALDSEAQALRDEYNRIRQVTKFNGRVMIPDDTPLILQAGYGTEGTLSVSMLLRSVETTPTGTYSTVSTFGTAANGYGGALGDFNEDGKNDLVISNPSTHSVTLYVGNGDGTFKVGSSFVASTAAEVRSADFNSDGNLDLAIGSPVGGGSAFDSLLIMFGNGDGSFKAATSYDTGDSPDRIDMGDLNSDGYQDIIVNDYFEPAGLVLLGNSNGTFKAGISFTLSTGNQTAVRLYDVNKDGKLDYVSSSYTSPQSYIFIGLGNGDGTFQSKINVGTNSGGNNQWQEPAMGDVDGDGDIDIVVAGGTLNEVAVFLGNGDMTFKARVTYAAGTSPFSSKLIDTNNDDVLDIIATTTDGRASIYLGNGNGTFKARTSYSVGTVGSNIITGDVTGDGVEDFTFIGVSGTGFGILESDTVTRETLNGIRELESFSLRTASGALSALDTITSYFNDIGTVRGYIGAAQSRIEIAKRTLGSAKINTHAAESRIIDADIAGESAASVAANIRVQMATSVMAQANAQNRLVLDLLN